MLLLETVFFLAAATAIGFLLARYVLVQPEAEINVAETRWRIEAENAAREREQLRAELEEARRARPDPAESEARIAHLKSAVHAAKRRIEELERALEEARRPVPSKAAVAAGPVGVAPPALETPEGEADDLKRIAGIGPGVERTLNQLGIWHYRQIAALNPENVAWLDRRLPVRGRIERQDWVAQAQALTGAHAATPAPLADMAAAP
jgi:predicted flap endonuclease-1-like 5' DNA nuclease